MCSFTEGIVHLFIGKKCIGYFNQITNTLVLF